MGVCNCSMFCCMLLSLYVHSSIAIILMGKRELIALLNLSSWCFVMVERLFLGMPRGCLRFVIVVFPDHTYYFQCQGHSLKSCVFSLNSCQLPIFFISGKIFIKLWSNDHLTETECRTNDSAMQDQGQGHS